jgi:hypothetical protein
MKANSTARTSTTTEKRCVTKEDFERDRLKLVEARECATTVLNSPSTSAKAKLVCDIEGMHATGTLELLAVDPEHVNGSSQSKIDGNGHTMNVEVRGPPSGWVPAAAMRNRRGRSFRGPCATRY